MSDRVIEVAGMALEVRERPETSTFEITVDRDGSLFVGVPAGTPDEPVLDFVGRKQDWIHRKLIEKADFLPALPPKEFANGEGFRYLGRNYRLLLVEDQEVPVKLVAGRLRLRRVESDSAVALRKWYFKTGTEWIRERIGPWAERCGLDHVDYEVRELGYRWGSLGSNGRLNLHWATFQLRPGLIDYVLVHELTHETQPAHDEQFWHAVETVLPDYQSRRSELAIAGSTVWLGQVNSAETTQRS